MSLFLSIPIVGALFRALLGAVGPLLGAVGPLLGAVCTFLGEMPSQYPDSVRFFDSLTSSAACSTHGVITGADLTILTVLIDGVLATVASDHAPAENLSKCLAGWRRKIRSCHFLWLVSLAGKLALGYFANNVSHLLGNKLQPKCGEDKPFTDVLTLMAVAWLLFSCLRDKRGWRWKLVRTVFALPALASCVWLMTSYPPTHSVGVLVTVLVGECNLAISVWLRTFAFDPNKVRDLANIPNPEATSPSLAPCETCIREKSVTDGRILHARKCLWHLLTMPLSDVTNRLTGDPCRQTTAPNQRLEGSKSEDSQIRSPRDKSVYLATLTDAWTRLHTPLVVPFITGLVSYVLKEELFFFYYNKPVCYILTCW